MYLFLPLSHVSLIMFSSALLGDTHNLRHGTLEINQILVERRLTISHLHRITLTSSPTWSTGLRPTTARPSCPKLEEETLRRATLSTTPLLLAFFPIIHLHPPAIASTKNSHTSSHSQHTLSVSPRGVQAHSTRHTNSRLHPTRTALTNRCGHRLVSGLDYRA